MIGLMYHPKLDFVVNYNYDIVGHGNSTTCYKCCVNLKWLQFKEFIN